MKRRLAAYLLASTFLTYGCAPTSINSGIAQGANKVSGLEDSFLGDSGFNKPRVVVPKGQELKLPSGSSWKQRIYNEDNTLAGNENFSMFFIDRSDLNHLNIYGTELLAGFAHVGNPGKVELRYPDGSVSYIDGNPKATKAFIDKSEEIQAEFSDYFNIKSEILGVKMFLGSYENKISALRREKNQNSIEHCIEYYVVEVAVAEKKLEQLEKERINNFPKSLEDLVLTNLDAETGEILFPKLENGSESQIVCASDGNKDVYCYLDVRE